jgi:phosphopantetheinyl transferase
MRVDLSFDVSHIRGLVACLIGKRCDLGVDTEDIESGIWQMKVG